MFRLIDPKALDAAFSWALADVAALLREGDVVAIEGKVLRGARDAGESARTRMIVSACAAVLRLTLARVPADRGAEPEAALEVLGLIGSFNSTFIDKQNWIAALEKTSGRPGRPSCGACQAISLSSQISSDPRLMSAAV